jgi:hypothetical protein
LGVHIDGKNATDKYKDEKEGGEKKFCIFVLKHSGKNPQKINFI